MTHRASTDRRFPRPLARGPLALGLAAAAALAATAPGAARAGSPAPARADLALTRVSAPPPGLLRPGAVLLLGAVLRNDGRGPAGDSVLAVHLAREGSPDLRLPGRGTRFAALGAVRSARRALSLRIPFAAAAGTYRVIACADARREVAETSERDNCLPAVRPLRIVTALPGLPGVPIPSRAAGAVRTAPPPPPPPDQASPARLGGAALSIADQTRFLWSGRDARQRGVAAGAIDPRRVVVLRGRVLDGAGRPLASARVRVLGHPEDGVAASREDGSFDIALDGGGPVVLDISRTGSLPVQREIPTGWGEILGIGDVRLTAIDDAATVIRPGVAAPFQVHRATPQRDGDGERRATLLFPRGVRGTVTLPGGARRRLRTMTVRATEYTTGAHGPERMPGTLPPASAYAYAVDLGVDQGGGTGARGVAFDRPVVSYTEDFLGLPVGSGVTVGRYDRAAGRWLAVPDGRVVEVTGVDGGRARLDVDGGPGPDGGRALAALGVTGAELSTLARLYPPGTRLMRVRLTRSGPYALGSGPALPEGATSPAGAGAGPGNGTPDGTPCTPVGGWDVGCERQRLAETIPVAGTPFSLRYRSDLRPGYLPNRTIDIPVTGDEVAGPLKRVEVSVDVAGRHVERTYPPLPGQRFRYVWDGLDGWGRRVPSTASARITLAYVYPEGYRPGGPRAARSFGDAGASQGPATVPGRGASELRVVQTVTRSLGAPDPRDTDALGGLTLDVHDAYDPQARTLFQGDGRISGGPQAGLAATRIAAAAGVPGGGIAAGPDGTVYLLDSAGGLIRRVTPDGRLRPFAGDGERGAPTGDGGPATAARLGHRIIDVAAGADGSVYVLVAAGPADSPDQRIRRIAPGGRISTVAGGPRATDMADGIPARRALIDASAITVGPDGAIYLDDYEKGRLRRIGPDGRIYTLAGGGAAAPSTAPRPGREVRLGIPARPALAPDGSIYLATEYQNRVLRLTPDGMIAVVAGTGDQGAGPASGRATAIDVPKPRRLAVGPDGTLYVASADTFRSGRAPIVAVSPAGLLTPFAGDSGCARARAPETVNPLAECFDGSGAMTVLPDGSVVYAGSGGALRRTGPPYPGFGAARLEIPSPDGRSVDVFDGRGRHLETRDALTGGVRYRFAYDGAGRLVSVTDGAGGQTRIERGAGGRATAIIAPGGGRTALSIDRAGDLVGVTDPLGESVRLGYGRGGLMTSLTRPDGGVAEMRYDARGLLTRVRDADGVRLDLARSEGDDTVSVAATDGDGYTVSYRDARMPDGTRRHTVTDAAGGVRARETSNGPIVERTEPDGTVVMQRLGPDPRFGLMAPVVEAQTVTSPGGRASALERTLTAKRSAPGGPGVLREALTVDGARSVWSYAYGSRTATLRTAAGRRWTWKLDGAGRVVEMRPPGEAPIRREFDARGRLARVVQGPVALLVSYEGSRRIVRAAGPGGPVVTELRDAAGRLRSVAEAGARTTFAHGADGDLTGVKLPRGGRYALAFSRAGRYRGYTAPGARAGLVRSYGPGGRLQRETLPSGRSVMSSPDTAGRLAGRSGGGVATSYDYAGPTDRLATLIRTAPPTGGSAPPEPAATLAMDYDGAALTGLTWGGPFDARATFSRDGAGSLTGISETVAGETKDLEIRHDADGLATGIGPFRFTRGGPGGRVTRAVAGGLRASFDFDVLGRPVSRSYAVDGAGLVYREQLAYDPASRVSRRSELASRGGGRTATAVETLSYDAASRLAEVRRGSVVLERYRWDADGNRISRRLGGAPAQASAYDAADGIVDHGGIPYTVNADGFVTRRGGDTFAYTADGELIRAVVGGREVIYRYDGAGRRISRTGTDGTTRYLYDDPRDAWRLTATIDPGGGSTRYLYDDGGLLLAIVRGGARFLVATDVDGTPHVVAGADGSIKRRIATDSFGRVTADTAPSFPLAVGFGGGLADPETGLVRLGVRDYDPETGRFTSRDPAVLAPGETNLYAYAGGNPVARRDPTGLGCGVADGGAGGVADGLVEGAGGLVNGFTEGVAGLPGGAAGPTNGFTEGANGEGELPGGEGELLGGEGGVTNGLIEGASGSGGAVGLQDRAPSTPEGCLPL